MVANDGFGGIIAACYRRHWLTMPATTMPATTMTARVSFRPTGNAQPQQDRGRDGYDAKVSIARIYPRHSDFLLHSVS
jgi:hypothetical protein